MSEYVSRAEFEELKGQLQYVCEKFGISSDLISEGSGRRRAAVEETESLTVEEAPDFSAEENDSLPVAPVAFDEDESTSLPTAPAASYDEEEASDEDTKTEDTGWESINDDEEHSIDYTPREAQPVEETSYDEEEFTLAAPASDEDDDDSDGYGEELTEENYVSDETTVFSEVDESVSSEKLAAIFEDDNALTSNHVAAKKFAEVTKGLFSTPYDEDQVDDFLDEYYEIFKSREVSEKDYAEALLKLDEVSFGEAQKGYKKAEVDSFIDSIRSELNRRIDILS